MRNLWCAGLAATVAAVVLHTSACGGDASPGGGLATLGAADTAGADLAATTSDLGAAGDAGVQDAAGRGSDAGAPDGGAAWSTDLGPVDAPPVDAAAIDDLAIDDAAPALDSLAVDDLAAQDDLPPPSDATPQDDAAAPDTSADDLGVPDATGDDALPADDGGPAEAGDDAAEVGDDAALPDDAPDGATLDVPLCDPAPCDDGDPCTKDGCDVSGCTHVAAPGCVTTAQPCEISTDCALGAVCDVGLHACVVCVSDEDCGSGKYCHKSKCISSKSCKSDTACKATQQVCAFALGVCVDCASKVDCGAEQACVEHACVPAAPCKSSKECPAVCDLQKGFCAECAVAADCAAGSYCDALSRCAPILCNTLACAGPSAFACKPNGGGYEAPKLCGDGNGCTDDGCLPEQGCLFTANTGPCDDANACTEGDVCTNGACAPGSAKTCDDGNACTQDACEPVAGCVAPALADGTPCGDKSICLGGTCVNAWCGDGSVNQPSEACDDGNATLCDACEGCQRRYVLDGTKSGYLSGPPLGLTEAGTVELWLARTQGGDHRLVYQNHPNSPGGGSADWGIRANGGQFEAFVGSFNNTVTVSAQAPADGKWRHVALVFTKIDVRLYVDGAFAGGKLLPKGIKDFNAGPAFTIGATETGGGAAGGWLADEVRVSSVPRYGPAFVPARRFDPDPATVALWHFDEGTGTSFANTGSKAVDLKVAGGLGWAADSCYGVASGTAACGDGKKAPWEACDDGNAGSGDGCTPGCGKEAQGTSCADVLAKQPGSPDGVYVIDPDGPDGPVQSFSVFCDMTAGGFTLAMKVHGGKQTFVYDSGHWVADWPYAIDKLELDDNEAKLPSFSTVPFTEVRIAIHVGSDQHWLTIPTAAPSLLTIFSAGTWQPTALGRPAWKGLVSGSSLQNNSNPRPP